MQVVEILPVISLYRADLRHIFMVSWFFGLLLKAFISHRSKNIARIENAIPCHNIKSNYVASPPKFAHCAILCNIVIIWAYPPLCNTVIIWPYPPSVHLRIKMSLLANRNWVFKAKMNGHQNFV